MKVQLTNSLLWTVLLLLAGGLPGGAHADNGKDKARTAGAVTQILIVGLDENVKSNYFPKVMIAEETGMDAENIDREYNAIIAENIAATTNDGDYKFISPAGDDCKQIIGEIIVNGEDEENTCDMSNVPPAELQKLLDQAGADYLLVLNRHYLRWQETPLRTLFHTVSYALFDKNKQEICHGNSYFTSMALENPARLRKISRKTSSKIASSVIKSLDDR
jgi:hypothetical protein